MQNKVIFGLDDAGRGALAGPLIVACTHYPAPSLLWHLGVRDSKALKLKDRALVFETLLEIADFTWAVAIAEGEWVNRVGTSAAESQKTRSALDDLISILNIDYQDIHLNIDGNTRYQNLPKDMTTTNLVSGERICPLVAAASVVATVHHDREMQRIAKLYPDWEFELNRGYSSKKHLQMLYELGPLPVHRKKAATTAVANFSFTNGYALPEWSVRTKPYYATDRKSTSGS